ncbi:MAG: hypothetical protein IPK26_13560 [Planctomycetes bacterium]|nr:hypothetical protein [Planctomycetota bacterium]
MPPDPKNAVPQCTRRDALAMLGAFGTIAIAPRAKAEPPPQGTLVERNDAAVTRLLEQQIHDIASPFCGAVSDQHGLHGVGSASGLITTFAASFVHPQSAFHHQQELLARIGLAADFLVRSQSPRGNIDLLVTNFDSPPDTGFVVHGVATAAAIARRHGREDLVKLLQPFLQKAGAGLAVGGIHTPNHRWVVCQALAQIHELWPDAKYLRRIDEWLAEGIDIDADGQFTERSTVVYNPINDRALCVMAHKLGRAELLEPVRRNLRTLPFLLHADGELVTEISRRQDQFQRGMVAGYWLPLALLARQDQDAQLAALALAAEPGATLASVLEYPELQQPTVAPSVLPDDFVQEMPVIGIVRIRRQRRSATVLLGGSSRLLTLRSGAAVLEGLRMAAAFFGKGQFVPDVVERMEGGWRLRQSLVAPYYQPLAEKVEPADWFAARARRQQSEVCRLEMVAEIAETERGLRVRLSADGTKGVPVAVEFGFRAGGEVVGCRALAEEPGCFVLEAGSGVYRVGGDEIRFGPGSAPHRYVQVRGAEARMGGTSVHVTGFTPFEQTLEIEA